MNTTTISTTLGRLRILLAVGVALGAALAHTAGADAAVRFGDGAYARAVYACKASTPNMLNFATYANTSGIWIRSRVFVYYANSRNVNQWAAWTSFSRLSSGYDYSADTINGLPDGRYLFQIQYARLVQGKWAYVSEYVPVFQYSDGWANMRVILNSASLPANKQCTLGMTQIVIS